VTQLDITQRPHPVDNKTTVSSPTLLQKCFAEFIGTYCLVFSGTGAIVVDSITHQVTPVGVAMVFGLIVMALIYAFGHVSGAHFNPAVTIGFVVAGEMRLVDAPLYIAAQMAGAVCASCTLVIMFGNVHYLGATIPSSSW